jgi:hypothetical protein
VGERGPGEGLVEERARLRLALPDSDWRAVRRAVRKGEAAPDRLKPAAYELATELAEVHRGSRWPLSRRRMLLIAAIVYVVLAGIHAALEGPDPGMFIRPIPVASMIFVLSITTDGHRRRVRAAVEANC